jgi:hypothetical protein
MYDNYQYYIQSFINTDINEWSFKSNIHYNGILEHLTNDLGQQCLDIIKNKFADFYDKNKDLLVELCYKNDKIGNPNKYDFKDFAICSSSNIRYILHSLIIFSYMKKCNINETDIIEIGGGYGGLCFFMYNLASLFDIKIKSYSMFDLYMPMLLQKKFLEYYNIYNINFEILDNIQNLKKNSFLISNYAYTEIIEDIRQKYTEQVIKPYTTYGFICWNTFLPHNYHFIDNKEIIITEEEPNTGLPVMNYYVYYKPI